MTSQVLAAGPQMPFMNSSSSTVRQGRAVYCPLEAPDEALCAIIRNANYGDVIGVESAQTQQR